jgi:hypothetical protein
MGAAQEVVPLGKLREKALARLAMPRKEVAR